MSLRDLQELVSTQRDRFHSTLRESPRSLDLAEEQLGVPLPAPVRWFLSECGYCDVPVVPNLQEAVSATLVLRSKLSLPIQLLMIEDRGDAGVVLLDTASEDGSVMWIASHNLGAICGGHPPDHDVDFFATFAEWVTLCLQG